MASQMTRPGCRPPTGEGRAQRAPLPQSGKAQNRWAQHAPTHRAASTPTGSKLVELEKYPYAGLTGPHQMSSETLAAISVARFDSPAKRFNAIITKL
jgi:hypothetical protein